MNRKNERIRKLYLRGLSVEQITKKLGLLSSARVLDGLKWLREHGELPNEHTKE